MIKTHTNQEIQNFRPKCLGGKGYKARSIAVSSTGFVLPCCWLDSHKDEVKELFDDSLKLNSNTVDEVINSDIWKKFNEKIKSEKVAQKSMNFDNKLDQLQNKFKK